MLAIFDLIFGSVLLFSSFLPFQNFELAIYLIAGCFALWLFALVIWRKRRLISSSAFFHFSLILSYHLRAIMAPGDLVPWFSAVVFIQWGIVLWLMATEEEEAPSIFLLIAMISPLYAALLHPGFQTPVGIFFWLLPVARLSFLSPAVNWNRRIWLVVVLLALSTVSILFSSYSWKSIQFLLINLGCGLLYLCCSRFFPQNRRAVLAGFLAASLPLVVFALFRLVLLLKYLGMSSLGLRLWANLKHNDLVPVLLIFSALALHFLIGQPKRFVRIFLTSALVLNALLLFLTYSRAGWASFLVFAILVVALQKKWNRKKKSLAAVFLGTGGILLLLLLPQIRKTVGERILYPVSERAYCLNLGVEQVSRHPFFGTGWQNYYLHSALVNPAKGLENIYEAQTLLAAQTHSVFLDMAEASGIGFAAAFFLFWWYHLKVKGSIAVRAGLAGLLVNSIVDSAPFWLTSYPLLWILFALAAPPDIQEKRIPRKLLAGAGLLIALMAGFVVVEDRYLLLGSFQYRSGSEEAAIRSFRTASQLVPVDAVPLEREAQVRLSRMELKPAGELFSRLVTIKKNYAPYYAELGRIEHYQKRTSEASSYLQKARTLDPHNALRGITYIELASLAFEQQRIEEFESFLSQALLRPLAGEQLYSVMSLIASMDRSALVDKVVQFAERSISSNKDWVTAMDNFRRNLTTIGEDESVIALLERVIGKKEKLKQEHYDYFANLLAARYFKRGELQKLRNLTNEFEGAGEPLVARIQIEEKRFEEALRNMQKTLTYYNYDEVADAWEQLFLRAGMQEQLQIHYRVLLSLPSEMGNAHWRRVIAESFYEAGQYGAAAKAYGELSVMSFDDPNPHWWQARCWWLAGQPEKARKANERCMSLVPRNKINEVLYKSRMTIPLWRASGVVRSPLPNAIGATQWRSGFLSHPPALIQLPADVRIRTIQGKVMMIGGAWFHPTDGVTFLIGNDHQMQYWITVDPRNNPTQRQGKAFEWISSAGPGPISLMTGGGGNTNYDWAMWFLEKVE